MVSTSQYMRPSSTPKQLAQPALNLPYHYVILLGLMGAVLHWMVSQAFFLASVRILHYPPTVNDDPKTGFYVNAGYSAIAIIFALGIGSVALLILVGMGFRRYNN